MSGPNSDAGSVVLAVDTSRSSPAAAVAVLLTPPPQDGTPDTTATLIADYRHACEEWGATMLDSWHDRVIKLEDKLVASLSSATERAERAEGVLEKVRVALRSIGPIYYHVEAASRRAAKSASLQTAADALEHVYGRLYWMDYALGTMQERVATDLPATPPESPLFNPITTEAP